MGDWEERNGDLQVAFESASDMLSYAWSQGSSARSQAMYV